MPWINVNDAMPDIYRPVLVQNKIRGMKVNQDEYAVVYLDEHTDWRVIDQALHTVHGQVHEKLELDYEPTHWLAFTLLQ